MAVNQGGVSMEWELSVLSNPANLAWNISVRNGSLAAGITQDVTLFLSPEGLQAGASGYETNFTIRSSSLEPTPNPKTRSIPFVVHTTVSATPDPAKSYVTMPNVTQLAAGDSADFRVTPVDSTGLAILDFTKLEYFGKLTHPASNTSVECRVGYDSASKSQASSCQIPSHVNRQRVCDEARAAAELLLSCCQVGYDLASESQAGSCQIPNRVNRQRACDKARAAEAQCNESPPVGEFTFEVQDTNGMLVGTRYSFFVAICPNDYYRSSNVCYLCPSGTVCPKGTTLETLQLLPGRWRSGVCTLSCWSIVFVTVVVCLRKFNHPIIGLQYLNNDCLM